MGEKFNLTWHTFSSHSRELFKNLMETQEFTDVTLISDDQQQYRVHKFILSACSTAFRKILHNNPTNSSIYLRGIHHEELESILQFIYLGEATVYHERMNEFVNVAKNLDIKEIGKNVVDEECGGLNMNYNQYLDQEDPIESDKKQSSDVTISSRTTSQEINKSDPSPSMILDDARPYHCQQCDFKASRKDNLKVHVQNKHEGIKYPCQQCDYQANSSSNLQAHVKSKHEGIKYLCQQCDYQGSSSSNLQVHVKSKHEGIKYPCQQCDYQATTSFNLQVHVKFKHEGIKYPCQQCDYQANTSNRLQTHVEYKHLDIKNQCQLCDYQATTFGNLQKHVKVKHDY